MAEDYYSILGVSRTATQDEILKAYRTLARKNHPDLNPNDPEAEKRFKAVQNAYNVLKDPEKRKLYDRYGAAFEQYSQAGAGGGGARYSGNGGAGGAQFEFGDFADFFGKNFGFGANADNFGDVFQQFRTAQSREHSTRGRRRRAHSAPPAESVQEISVPFATAIQGGTTRLSVQRPDGSSDTIDVRIPAGLSDGQNIRLRGQGGDDFSGAADLIIKVRVQPHRWFTRQGNDLIVKLPVTLAEATLGGKVEVPTPNGTVTMTLPPGTSSGTKLRAKGQGVPARKNEAAGDLLVEVQIKLPKDLTADEQDAIREIDAAHPMQPRSDLRW